MESPSSGLDETNKKIITLLQRNGRRSYVSIAKEIGLSEAAVRLRVQRLTEDGIIKIVAVTDPEEMGYHRQAMVGITVNGDIEKVTAQLRNIPRIDYIIITAGRFDILAEVYAEDDEAMLQLVNRSIRGIDGISHTELFSYMRAEDRRCGWSIA